MIKEFKKLITTDENDRDFDQMLIGVYDEDDSLYDDVLLDDLAGDGGSGGDSDGGLDKDFLLEKNWLSHYNRGSVYGSDGDRCQL